MTGTIPVGQPPPDDLTARVFRALYQAFDLHTIGGTRPAPPAPPGASPARAAADLARALARHGITGVYTATAAKFAVISVTADVTIWTNGHQLWCTHHGQPHTWPATDTETTAARIAALALLRS